MTRISAFYRGQPVAGHLRLGVLQGLRVLQDPFIVLALLCAGVAVARAQEAVPPLERLINQFAAVRTPIGPCTVPRLVASIARSAEFAVGVETVAEPCNYVSPSSAAPSSEIANLNGLAVREALDLLVKIDPRYRWAEVDDVIVVRPVAAWGFRDHFLHRTVTSFGFDDQNLWGAFHHLRLAFGQPSPEQVLLRQGRTAMSDKKFTVRSRTRSLLEALDAVVAAHGALQWEIAYCQPELRLEFAMLSLFPADLDGVRAPMSYEDQSGRTIIPCMTK
jgi:hypothetical protein